MVATRGPGSFRRFLVRIADAGAMIGKNPSVFPPRMKTILLSLASLLLPFSPAFAQFPPLPAADLVLGAADFDTAGSGVSATGLDYPSGIAIDPTSGAVFVSLEFSHRVLRFSDWNALVNGAAAEAVIGQANFTDSDPGVSATAFNEPSGLHVDSSGRLWVADRINSRVLMFANASGLANGAAATLVLGQPDFITSAGGTTDAKMINPSGVFVDGGDQVWVADAYNNRVLKFGAVSTLVNGAAAVLVLGQSNFTDGGAATIATKMANPSAVWIDAYDHLWVAERLNHRILRFSNASMLANGAPADRVLGQPDFSPAVEETDAQSLREPTSLFTDPEGTLWVSDTTNHRVLLFKNARLKSNGAPADDVIGQADFTTNTPGLSARKMGRPLGIALDPSGRLWVCDSENARVLRFSPDKIRPVLKVTKVPRKTSKAKLKIQGTAGDASGIASVRYRVGKSAYRSARGAVAWKFNAKLKPGLNKIEIMATDAVGNLSASKRVKVRRG